MVMDLLKTKISSGFKKCGVTFRLFVPQASTNFVSSNVPIIPDVPHLSNAEELSARLDRTNIGPLKRKRLQDEADEMALFRRVRIRISLTLPSQESRPGSIRRGSTDATSIRELSPIQSLEIAKEASDEEEPYTIKCICDFYEDDGNTIYCETCDTWQHIECFYPGRVEEASRDDFEHSCADCKPRPLDRRQAKERGIKLLGRAQHGTDTIEPADKKEYDDGDGRSISGSVRSRSHSRDLTPPHGFNESNGILTKLSDREKRKLASLEESFRKMEQGQPPRRKWTHS
ncbi:hypothetical protein BKA64DRAFT_649117 [Cadophora sp. MPI-SDFR-AT-0126]|nr:hypothetical protein BKA64DRAFT_649117 [Leotiomycetes sp. MPI-SDFR-AT-0126]